MSTHPDAPSLVGQSFRKKFSGYGVLECTVVKYDPTHKSPNQRSNGQKYFLAKFVGTDDSTQWFTYEELMKVGLYHRSSSNQGAVGGGVVGNDDGDDDDGTGTTTSTSKELGTVVHNKKLFNASLLDARKLNPRKRKQRFVNIDGHTVLKSNNYGLEDGISTFSGSASQRRRRSLPKIKSATTAYGAFTKEHGYGVTAAAGKAWRAVSEADRKKYHDIARLDKVRHSTETAARAELLHALDAEDVVFQLEAEAQEKLALEEQEEKARQVAAKKLAKALAKRGQPKKERRSAHQMELVNYNRRIKNLVDERLSKRNEYLQKHTSALSVFVGETLVGKLNSGSQGRVEIGRAHV